MGPHSISALLTGLVALYAAFACATDAKSLTTASEEPQLRFMRRYCSPDVSLYIEPSTDTHVANKLFYVYNATSDTLAAYSCREPLKVTPGGVRVSRDHVFVPLGTTTERRRPGMFRAPKQVNVTFWREYTRTLREMVPVNSSPGTDDPERLRIGPPLAAEGPLERGPLRENEKNIPDSAFPAPSLRPDSRTWVFWLAPSKTTEEVMAEVENIGGAAPSQPLSACKGSLRGVRVPHDDKKTVVP